DLFHAITADVDDAAFEPLPRDLRQARVAIDQVALRLARAARVALLRALRVAQDQRAEVLARGGDADREPARFRVRDVDDAELVVDRGVRGFRLEYLRFGQRAQVLAQLRDVGGIAALFGDGPAAGVFLDGCYGVAAGLLDRHAIDVVEGRLQ